MTTFCIETNNDILAFISADYVPEGHEHFSTEQEFAKLSSEWQITRLVDVWNGFAGVVPFDTLKPVKKFTDRKTATTRIWTAIQKLDDETMRSRIRDAEATPKDAQTEPKVARHAAPAVPKKTKAAKEATTANNAPTPRPGSKTAIVLEMLRRVDGATLAEIMAATGWQSHGVELVQRERTHTTIIRSSCSSTCSGTKATITVR